MVDYRVHGSGPVLVVPELNVDWSRHDLSALEAGHTVVTITLAGFMGGGRRASYDDQDVVAEIESALDHLGVTEYATFGYSLSGAVASLLAVDNPRVRAVVCGGFPVGIDYSGLAERSRRMLAAWADDDDTWRAVLRTHDPGALVRLWEQLGRLAPGALLGGPACPVWSWWGDADRTIASLVPLAEHERALHDRHVTFRVLAGLDHAGALDRIDLVLPEVVAWLDDVRPCAQPG